MYQLQIKRKGVRPSIWRRLVVRGNSSQGQLHQTIQIAFGRGDCHLHCFEVEDETFGPSDDLDGDDVLDEKRYKLSSAAPEAKGRFKYIHDSGDAWLHDVLVEQILPPDPNALRPTCLAGERAGPPDDVVSAPGYEDMLTVIADPSHPEREDMLEWLGEDFDPELCDLAAINRQLKKLK